MEDLLKEETYSFVSPKDKKFIIAFDAEMDRLGYTSNQTIGDGYCWGRKMIIYTKADVKNKKSFARIYLREDDLILRMYFSNVDKHIQAIEQAPDYILQAFTGDYGACKHCHTMKEDGSCNHRKSYTIHGKKFCRRENPAQIPPNFTKVCCKNFLHRTGTIRANPHEVRWYKILCGLLSYFFAIPAIKKQGNRLPDKSRRFPWDRAFLTALRKRKEKMKKIWRTGSSRVQ